MLWGIAVPNRLHHFNKLSMLHSFFFVLSGSTKMLFVVLSSLSYHQVTTKLPPSCYPVYCERWIRIPKTNFNQTRVSLLFLVKCKNWCGVSVQYYLERYTVFSESTPASFATPYKSYSSLYLQSERLPSLHQQCTAGKQLQLNCLMSYLNSNLTKNQSGKNITYTHTQTAVHISSTMISNTNPS